MTPILKVRFRTREEFEEMYQEDLVEGGVFCPTTTEFSACDAVIVEMTAPALPNKLLIRGEVCRWRPALPRQRVRAGAIVKFSIAEGDKHQFLLGAMRGEIAKPRKRKHTRLPVHLSVQYRSGDSRTLLDATLGEISAGGALLVTTTPLELGSEVIIEITPPGSASAVSISGKVTYLLPNGSTGIKFLSRDPGGSRRLSELVRRLRSDK